MHRNKTAKRPPVHMRTTAKDKEELRWNQRLYARIVLEDVRACHLGIRAALIQRKIERA
jgi:hypothetical protein